MPWYAGDIHQHSHYSSPLYGGDDEAPDTLAEVFEFMRSKGLDFGAASDHHNILNHEAWKKFESTDFIPLVSKEISTGSGHVMALGADGDVVFGALGGSDERKQAEFRRVCDEIRRLGGIAQLNHPRDRKLPISFPERFTGIIDCFDTMEIWNGSERMEEGTKNGDAFRLWIALLEKGIYLPATSGSDQHSIKDYLRERWVKTFVRTERLERGNILRAIKNGNGFVTSGPFVEITVNGASYGETARHRGELVIDISVDSDREVDTLAIHRDGKPPTELRIGAASYRNRITMAAEDRKWLFFVAGTDPFNKAITNPVFLERTGDR